MKPEILSRLRELSRDDAAFKEVKQILADELQELDQEMNQAYFQVEQQKALFSVITPIFGWFLEMQLNSIRC